MMLECWEKIHVVLTCGVSPILLYIKQILRKSQLQGSEQLLHNVSILYIVIHIQDHRRVKSHGYEKWSSIKLAW
jgi:hypothetical protein